MNIREYGIEAAEHVVQEMAELGHVPTIDLVGENGQPAVIAEMIGTDDGAREFIEKVTYDAYAGRENVELVFRTIYRTQTDANFPQTMTAKEFGPVQVIFLKKLEGGEVKFGSLGPGTEKVVSFETWAAGLEYDEDIIEYNQTWRVSDIGVAFGEAYQHLLNHLHLSPLVDETNYTTTAGGLKAQRTKQEDPTNGAAQLIAFDTDIRKTFQNALQVLPRGSVVLYNSFDRFRIDAAIAGDLLNDGSLGPVAQAARNWQWVEYDGVTITVGKKTYTYDGVTAGKVRLVVPKRNFVEYVKHDLRVDSGDGDLSRLIVTQLVGRTRRAVMAGLSGADGAVCVELE